MINNKQKPNNWAIINLFNSYLKRNRAIIVSIFVLPIIFIVSLSLNYHNLFANGHGDGALILMMLWIIQGASFAIQTFVTILLDFKQSVVYRRIGLTRVKPITFLAFASLYNLALMIISDIFIFLVVIILGFSFNLPPVLNSIFTWELIVIILFTLAGSILLTAVATLMAALIKSRTGQTISGIIVNLVIIVPLFILVFFLNALNATSSNLIALVGIAGFIGIFIGAFVILILASAIIYYLTYKAFKWYE